MSSARWLTPTSGFLSGYTHSLNPYVGCAFGCSYCYVRRLPVGLFRGEPWGSWAEPKKADPSKLAKEISAVKRKGPVTVFFSSATDPYQPLEGKLGITRSLLKAMAEEPPNFVLVQTRSPLVTRDLELLRTLGDAVRVSMTIETDREDVRRLFTPSAPPLAARFRALRELREAGVATQAAVSPILPHTQEFAVRLVELAPRIVVDDYFQGDGSGGRRSEALGMRGMHAEHGLAEWYDPSVVERLVLQLRKLAPAHEIGVSAEGFAPTPLRG
ncbi:SPL family radical SAM protein [Cohnella panacarvi]|uniref:SPL family radical SAM protein n=1 Tax=Cohnella panacarvi TaxID=400776 RepID=UPI00047C68E1|nr:radical SAM protein [Cohnella panacarvi]